MTKVELKLEYRRVRANALAKVRRIKKQYDVESMPEIPAIPKVITEASIRRLLSFSGTVAEKTITRSGRTAKFENIRKRWKKTKEAVLKLGTLPVINWYDLPKEVQDKTNETHSGAFLVINGMFIDGVHGPKDYLDLNDWKSFRPGIDYKTTYEFFVAIEPILTKANYPYLADDIIVEKGTGKTQEYMSRGQIRKHKNVGVRLRYRHESAMAQVEDEWDEYNQDMEDYLNGNLI